MPVVIAMNDGQTERIVQWLRDGEEHEAAELLSECSLKYLYVDTLFEVGGEGTIDMVDVNVEAPRRIIKEVDAALAPLKNQIVEAIRDCARTSGCHVRDVAWVPKLTTAPKMPIGDEISALLATVDSEHVRKVWEKALDKVQRTLTVWARFAMSTTASSSNTVKLNWLDLNLVLGRGWFKVG